MGVTSHRTWCVRHWECTANVLTRCMFLNSHPLDQCVELAEPGCFHSAVAHVAAMRLVRCYDWLATTFRPVDVLCVWSAEMCLLCNKHTTPSCCTQLTHPPLPPLQEICTRLLCDELSSLHTRRTHPLSLGCRSLTISISIRILTFMQPYFLFSSVTAD